MAVLIQTNYGDLAIDLFCNEAPLACENFLKLSKWHFFTNSLFHRLERDFILEGGRSYKNDESSTVWKEMSNNRKFIPREDSTKEKMKKYSNYFPDQISSKLKFNQVGMVGCANTTRDENDSQFFITLRKELPSLNRKHTIFGMVSEGAEDVLLKVMNSVVTDPKTHKPAVPIRILSVDILYDPFDDPEGFELCAPIDQEVIIDKKVTALETAADEVLLLDELEQREARGRAVTLEIVGDIADAALRPDDKTLFVCKLNPDTEEEDLELIFGRFGEIKKCDVVRDHNTGDSLQYAFIEFERRKDAETAYFKMQNVLIDDRRIHVDFFQSVQRSESEYSHHIKRTAKRRLPKYRDRT